MLSLANCALLLITLQHMTSKTRLEIPRFYELIANRSLSRKSNQPQAVYRHKLCYDFGCSMGHSAINLGGYSVLNSRIFYRLIPHRKKGNDN